MNPSSGAIRVIIAALAVLGGSARLSSQIAAPPRVPLVVGLSVTNAVRAREGDYESVGRIDAISARGVELTMTADAPQAPGKPAEPVSVSRTVALADLAGAHNFKFFFNTMDEALIPGTTAITLSGAALNDLRAHGQTRLTLDGRRGGLVGLVDDLLTSTGGTSGLAGQLLGGGGLATGLLKLVEPAPVAVPVLLNGSRTTLNSYHLRGHIGEGTAAEDADLYVLDDPANPLVLRMAIGRDTSEVIRIDLPVPDPASVMEHALADTRRAVLYGIYFDFNSATIKPQSEAVLRQIVAVMKRQPTWTLKVEGHTDNVGGDARNLDLSTRRAAAVRAALVDRGLAADRLSAGGYGAAQPRETNATIAGRARNRRVELSRP